MFCFQRHQPSQAPFQVLLVGANTAKVTQALRAAQAGVAHITPSGAYLPGTTVALATAPQHYAEHGMRHGSNLARVGVSSVMEASVLDLIHRQPSHAVVFSYTPLHKVMSMGPQQAVQALREYAFLVKGSPVKTAKSLQWVTPKMVKDLSNKLSKAMGENSGSFAHSVLTHALNLAAHPKGVYVEPAIEALVVDATAPHKAAGHVLSHVRQLGGSNQQEATTGAVDPDSAIAKCQADVCANLQTLRDTLTAQKASLTGQVVTLQATQSAANGTNTSSGTNAQLAAAAVADHKAKAAAAGDDVVKYTNQIADLNTQLAAAQQQKTDNTNKANSLACGAGWRDALGGSNQQEATTADADSAMTKCHADVCTTIATLGTTLDNKIRDLGEQIFEAQALKSAAQTTQTNELNQAALAQTVLDQNTQQQQAAQLQSSGAATQINNINPQLDAVNQQLADNQAKMTSLACGQGWRAAV